SPLSFTIRPPTRSTLFPYTTLFRSRQARSENTVRPDSLSPPSLRNQGARARQVPFAIPGRRRERKGWNCLLRRHPRGDSVACSRSEEHTSELQSLTNLVCRLLLEKN